MGSEGFNLPAPFLSPLSPCPSPLKPASLSCTPPTSRPTSSPSSRTWRSITSAATSHWIGRSTQSSATASPQRPSSTTSKWVPCPPPGITSSPNRSDLKPPNRSPVKSLQNSDSATSEPPGPLHRGLFSCLL